MATTKLDICSAALILCGAEELVTFDGSFSSKIVSAVYDSTKSSLIVGKEWTFAQGQSSMLSLLTGTPEFRWSYAYRLPSNCLSVLEVYPNIQYEISEDKLFTDYNGKIYVSMEFLPEEDTLPGYFVHYFILYLASVICIPVTEDATKAKELRAEAVSAGVAARNADAKQRKNRGFKNFPLIFVRG